MRVRDIGVGKLIGESPHFRIYLGKKDDGQDVILKVAKTLDDGKILTDEAGKFSALEAFSDRTEEIGRRFNASDKYHYDWLFAKLLASFMEPTQQDRTINVFTVLDTELDKLTPLTKLKAEVEIDVRTSIWILGRLFKFYSFLELMALEEPDSTPRYPTFTPDDYLIGPERHRLVFYNFSGDLPDSIANDYVKAISQFMLEWVAENDDTYEQEYMDLLTKFANEGCDSFQVAHICLYDFVKRCWGIKYHPFTYRERNTLVWKTIQEKEE